MLTCLHTHSQAATIQAHTYKQTIIHTYIHAYTQAYIHTYRQAGRHDYIEAYIQRQGYILTCTHTDMRACGNSETHLHICRQHRRGTTHIHAVSWATTGIHAEHADTYVSACGYAYRHIVGMHTYICARLTNTYIHIYTQAYRDRHTHMCGGSP